MFQWLANGFKEDHFELSGKQDVGFGFAIKEAAFAWNAFHCLRGGLAYPHQSLPVQLSKSDFAFQPQLVMQ